MLEGGGRKGALTVERECKKAARPRPARGGAWWARGHFDFIGRAERSSSIISTRALSSIYDTPAQPLFRTLLRVQSLPSPSFENPLKMPPPPPLPAQLQYKKPFWNQSLTPQEIEVRTLGACIPTGRDRNPGLVHLSFRVSLTAEIAPRTRIYAYPPINSFEEESKV
jgi:hypothetical protein